MFFRGVQSFGLKLNPSFEKQTEEDTINEPGGFALPLIIIHKNMFQIEWDCKDQNCQNNYSSVGESYFSSLS